MAVAPPSTDEFRQYLETFYYQPSSCLEMIGDTFKPYGVSHGTDSNRRYEGTKYPRWDCSVLLFGLRGLPYSTSDLVGQLNDRCSPDPCPPIPHFLFRPSFALIAFQHPMRQSNKMHQPKIQPIQPLPTLVRPTDHAPKVSSSRRLSHLGLSVR